MNIVLPQEKAKAEIDKWLDHKRVKQSVREIQEASINTLVDAMMYGELTLNESSYELTHILNQPVPGLVEKLTYKPRLSVGELLKATSSVKNVDEKAMGYVAAIAGVGVSHIQKMDIDDFKVSQAVAVFFT